MADPRVSRLREVIKNGLNEWLQQWEGAANQVDIDLSDPVVVTEREDFAGGATIRCADILQQYLDGLTPPQAAERMDDGLPTIIAALRDDATEWDFGGEYIEPL